MTRLVLSASCLLCWCVAGCDVVFGARTGGHVCTTGDDCDPGDDCVDGRCGASASEGEGEGEDLGEGEGEDLGEGEGEGEGRAPPEAWKIQSGAVAASAVGPDGTLYVALDLQNETATFQSATSNAAVDLGVVETSTVLLALKDGALLWRATVRSNDTSVINFCDINALGADDNAVYVVASCSRVGVLQVTPGPDRFDDGTIAIADQTITVAALEPATGRGLWLFPDTWPKGPSDDVPFAVVSTGVVVGIPFTSDGGGVNPFDDSAGPSGHQALALGKLRGDDGTLEWTRTVETDATLFLDGLNIANSSLAGSGDELYVRLEGRTDPAAIGPFGGAACAATDVTASDDGSTPVVLGFNVAGQCRFANSVAEPITGAYDDSFGTFIAATPERVVLVEKDNGGNRRTVTALLDAADGTGATATIDDVDSVGGLARIATGLRGVFAADADANRATASFQGTPLEPLTNKADFFVVDLDVQGAVTAIRAHLAVDSFDGQVRGFSASDGGALITLRDVGATVAVGDVVFTVDDPDQVLVFVP